VTVTPPGRKALAIFCIALVVFAAIAPTIASEVGAGVLTALWLVVPAVVVTVVRRTASTCNEQPVALFALVRFRAPPTTFVLS
jgi:hypothetical protein